MRALLRSRKFWLMILDVVISTATYFVTAYVAPEVAEQIIWVIGAWQPVIVALIVGIAVEDAAVKGTAPFSTYSLGEISNTSAQAEPVTKDENGLHWASGENVERSSEEAAG
jgi:hypothetical protein